MQELCAGVDDAKDWLYLHHLQCGTRLSDIAPSALKAFVTTCILESA
ncbi:MAG: hypothetical protein ACXIU8_04800 [Alkalilacustris sp.]